MLHLWNPFHTLDDIRDGRAPRTLPVQDAGSASRPRPGATLVLDRVFFGISTPPDVVSRLALTLVQDHRESVDPTDRIRSFAYDAGVRSRWRGVPAFRPAPQKVIGWFHAGEVAPCRYS